MNILRINIATVITRENVYGVNSYQAMEIYIDDVSLIEMVRKHEVPLAQAEGKPELAGGYKWLEISELSYSKLTGADAEEKTDLLGCICGCYGCWPLLAKIQVNGDVVTWSEFEQPHRIAESAAGLWSYEGFGPFGFDRSEYESQIESVFVG